MTAEFDAGGMSATIDCDMTSTTTGRCIQTVVGAASFFPDPSETAEVTATSMRSAEITFDLASSDISFFPVTITAGTLKTGAEASATSTTSSGSASESEASSTEGASASATGSDSAAPHVAMCVSGAFVGMVAALMFAL